MRIKRAKANKRALVVYHYSFGFRQPYQVLVDASFLHMASMLPKAIQESMATILFGDVKLMTTNCVCNELKQGGREMKKTFYLAKGLEKRRCAHDVPVSAHECLMSVITGVDAAPPVPRSITESDVPQAEGDALQAQETKPIKKKKSKEQLVNKHNYVVGTQDIGLRTKLRQVAGVPLVYISKSVYILEPASEATLNYRINEERRKNMPIERPLKEETNEETTNDQAKPVVNRKKKAKGPNPLSMKKKKKVNASNN